ncbi:hypothetical protein ID856_17930, partial [Xenorhabdus sp. 18]
YIEKSDKDGYWVSWQPTQEDLMACDWKFLQPDLWMSFDITLGYTTASIWTKSMGYLSNDMIPIIEEKSLFTGDPAGSIIQNSFGTLSNVQNQATSAIRAVEGFIFNTYSYNDNFSADLFFIASCEDKDKCQKVVDLLSKNLAVTVDGNTYNLRPSIYNGILDNHMVGSSNGYIAYMPYDYYEIIGGILEQTGETKHFHFRWYDNINYLK